MFFLFCQVTKYQKTDYSFDYYFEQSEALREQDLDIEDSSESEEEEEEEDGEEKEAVSAVEDGESSQKGKGL